MEPTYDVVSNPEIRGSGSVHGDESERLRVLFAGHSQTKPGHQNGPKVFDYYLLHHIVSGKGIYVCGDATFELAAGDSFVIEPGKLVAYRSDDEHPWFYRWVAVQGEQAGHLLAGCGVNWEAPVIRSGTHTEIGRWIEQIADTFRLRDTGANTRSIGLLHLIAAQFEGTIKPAHPLEEDLLLPVERHVKQLVHQLTTQYAEPISIEGLAESCGYNRAYLSKIFKQITGATPVTFLLHLRVGKARQLLRERPELSIEQIASSVGFNDPLYFSKQFRRFYQVSPSDYRKSVAHLLGK